MLRRIVGVVLTAIVLAVGLICWKDKPEPIGGGWYSSRATNYNIDYRGSLGQIERKVGREYILVGFDAYRNRFYPPDCILWQTGRTLWGGCGDRQPFPVAISNELDWAFLPEGAVYLGHEGLRGRVPPKVQTWIPIDSVKAVAERQPRLEATFRPRRDGGVEFDPALEPLAYTGALVLDTGRMDPLAPPTTPTPPPLDINWLNESKETQLHIAVRDRDREKIEALLRMGANANAGERLKITPLMLAVSGDKPVDMAIVNRLLAVGAYINATHAHGWTPLMFAARDADSVVIARLLDVGADPMRRDNDGASALSHAEHARRADDVLGLLKAAERREPR